MLGYTKYEPRLFYSGTQKLAIALEQAQIDTKGICNPQLIKTLFDVSAIKLMARIIRYTNGHQLRFPQELNYEGCQFYAIKSVNVPQEGWEKFIMRKGESCELEHLRAYFFEEVDANNDELVCITHFIKKETPKLQDEDRMISQLERDKFLRNGCDYVT